MYFRRSRRSLRRNVRIDGDFGGTGDEACDDGEGDVSEERPTVLELSLRRRLGESGTKPLYSLY